jgi:hypothetical protein
VQDHAVVLEAKTPGQLGELVILSRRPTACPQLRELLVQRIHLLDVPDVERHVFLDLVV